MVFINMPNVIASATTVANGSIKKNNFVIGVDTSIGYGPTSATTFWNGIIPPTSGYTVYAQKSVGGPSIRVANNDSELITIAQQYSGTNINTINDALSYLNSQSNFLVANIDYPSIVTSGLTLMLDAGYIPSYPRTGTTWNDLSGNGNNGTLVNGPSFNPADGGSIVFDGTDDYAVVSSFSQLPIGSNARTVNMWFKTNTTTWQDNVNNMFFYGATNTGNSFGIDFRVYPAMEFYSWGGAGRDIIFNTTFPQTGWSNLTVVYNGTTTLNIYENSINTQNATINVLNTISSNVWIGSINPSFNPWYYDGGIANIQIYDRALSSSEVLQNYNAYKSRFGL